jgi:hypothetical protein
MLTSDIALQLFQKIFQNFQVQDLSFGLRTINFVLVATYIIPVAPSVISEILKKVTQNCLL